MMSASLILHLPILVLYLTSFTKVSSFEQIREGEDGLPESDSNGLGKRLYDFGLGKRGYRYVTEYKRLPMYDFGLGKRAKQYSFGLGKRSDGEDDESGYDNYLDDGEKIPETEMYDDDSMQSAEEKRARSYSFGLGKRPMYQFGLGKRAKQYNFGLGKRERLYSFGLGKRNNRMYSFGLGKRDSADVDNYNAVDKREVNQNELKAVLQANDDQHSGEASNHTVIAESHEVMGHGDRFRTLQKRSPRQYGFGLGKRDSDYELPYPSSSQYRKPFSYSWGKRRQFNFGLGKRSRVQ